MIRAFFRSKEWFWWAYGIGILLIVLQYTGIFLALQLNDWYGNFSDLVQQALQGNVQENSKNSVDNLYSEIYKFFSIALRQCTVWATTITLSRFWATKWREAITVNYIKLGKNKEIEGSGQRIQEDPRKFAEIIELWGLNLINSCMTLIAFSAILWKLSPGVEIKYLEGMAGSLMWIALLTSGGGIIISWLVGTKLPDIDYDINISENYFRTELVRGEEDKTNYASEETLIALFKTVKRNYYHQALHLFYFEFWRSIYAKFMLVLTFIVMGPGIFRGLITLGVWAKVTDSFAQIHQSIWLFIDDWETLTKIRSIWWRMQELEEQLGNKDGKTA